MAASMAGNSLRTTIGSLRDLVTIEQKTTTDDGQGGRVASWSTLAKVHANVRPLSGTERLQAAAISASMPYEVTVRYRGDVSPTMRLQWTPYKATAARTLQIQGVRAQHGGRQWLMLDCAEVQA